MDTYICWEKITPAHCFKSQLRARGGTLSPAGESSIHPEEGIRSPEEQRWSPSCPSKPGDSAFLQHTELPHTWHKFNLFESLSWDLCLDWEQSKAAVTLFCLQKIFGVIVCPYLRAYIYKPLLHKKHSSALTYLATWNKIAWSYSCCLTYFFFNVDDALCKGIFKGENCVLFVTLITITEENMF